jgi:hypothetical protein
MLKEIRNLSEEELKKYSNDIYILEKKCVLPKDEKISDLCNLLTKKY